jgi:hypothetical protein
MAGGHDPLALCRGAAHSLSESDGGDGPDFCVGRSGLDVGRDDGGNRPGCCLGGS